MCVNNLPKVATQWNSGAIRRDSNRRRRVLIPSALTTTPPSHTHIVLHRCHCKRRTIKYCYGDDDDWRRLLNCQPSFADLRTNASKRLLSSAEANLHQAGDA